MNKKLNLAVAAALALGASAAQAGITIPAGDWTVDIGGNVNAFYTSTNGSGAGLLTAPGQLGNLTAGGGDAVNVRTGLLPSALGIGAKSRQNDLDVAFQFTFFVGGDDNNNGALGGNSINIRQSFLTFGDKSWGTIKAGRDIGIYGSEAILSDMTLLGVGGAASGAGGSSTLGHIGTGYLYADWVGQISYTSPNWNGFSFAVGVRDPWSSRDIQTALGLAAGGLSGAFAPDDKPGFEGKAVYDFTGGDVTGKVWVGGIYQDFIGAAENAEGWEIGGKAGVAGFEAVAYYYTGSGMGTTSFGLDGHTVAGVARDSDGYFLQGTYKLPTIGTKIGVSYGESNLDSAGADVAFQTSNTQWTVGVYHPLTKSLNLVAEYANLEGENDVAGGLKSEEQTFSLGAIMFF